eukprot:TRINITY_DN2456_c0_g1_i1.p4 TRINITY_DN2456_c0_g1~~TRINITY_DN2456_c0_g1_i1.p4  ORF type:complete len:100 (-),score=4.37 TRINITY_DN2456_c0_g1_i1:161-460(-)
MRRRTYTMKPMCDNLRNDVDRNAEAAHSVDPHRLVDDELQPAKHVPRALFAQRSLRHAAHKYEAASRTIKGVWREVAVGRWRRVMQVMHGITMPALTVL